MIDVEDFINRLSDVGDITIEVRDASSLTLRSMHIGRLRIFFETYHPTYNINYNNGSMILHINKDANLVCDIIKRYFLENNLLHMNHVKSHGKPGVLHFLNNMSFNTQRVFYIDLFNDVTSKNTRGFHANINFNEVLIVINGSIRITLIDKLQNKVIEYLDKESIYFVSKMSWVEYEILEPDTIIFCMADKCLGESRSITDFNEFLSIV
jgi:hypothetical protein